MWGFAVLDEGNDFIEPVEAIMGVNLVEGQPLGAELAKGALRAMKQAHDIARIEPDLGKVGMGQRDILFVDIALQVAHGLPPFLLRALTGTRTISSSSSTEKVSPNIQASISDLRNWSFAPALW